VCRVVTSNEWKCESAEKIAANTDGRATALYSTHNRDNLGGSAASYNGSDISRVASYST
jgi:hypothetical protein